jgi:hypothetical protein
LRISGQSDWPPGSVHRKIFFAISLAVPHAFLLLCDAPMSQFAQKQSIMTASEAAQGAPPI